MALTAPELEILRLSSEICVLAEHLYLEAAWQPLEFTENHVSELEEKVLRLSSLRDAYCLSGESNDPHGLAVKLSNAAMAMHLMSRQLVVQDRFVSKTKRRIAMHFAFRKAVAGV